MDLAIPINSAAVLVQPAPPRRDSDDDKDHGATPEPQRAKALIVVGGGGGPGKTGLKNKVCLLDWKDADATLRTDATVDALTARYELCFGTDEDAPWSLAVHPDGTTIAAGVNGPAGKVPNRNCRILRVSEDGLKETSALTTVGKSADDYQSAAEYSPDGQYLATGSDEGTFCLFHGPSLTPHPWSPKTYPSKVYTVAFSPSSKHVRITTAKAIHVLSTDSGDTLLEITAPAGRTFRAGRTGARGLFYTLINGTKPARSALAVWDFDASPTKPVKTTTLAAKPAVALAVGESAVAVALADCSLVILDAVSLRVLRVVRDAHDVPITSVVVPERRTVVSATGDGKVKVWRVPEPSTPWNPVLIAVVLAMVVVLLTWFVAAVVVPPGELVKLGVPFWRVDAQGGVRLVTAHVPWLRGMGLDAVRFG
ncbi:hypothetical protein AMAG_10617 [Allomyces macrogynus ATCC 38327]|uniref:Anaphase-promoting complex subunit 4 WD40 domain-containing protein n=1 Tax=Allomyces macrogynus (strain ATCC 38327) TaxID=578462 RepID=A0A0L0SR12_ALLM3|nr:hypothetical protein AMAG_10617 [Allomyces macrogynus ATCC 38327]|eukprot:KNE64952.1 hypothetical protein AMAG_10617 [Allomyces macrogynus ATCC 38327]